MRLSRITVALAGLTLSGLVSALPSYTITGLGSLSGQGSTAYGLNSNGMVVGQSFNASTNRTEAVVWSNGSIQSLGVKGVARAVNNSGTVVGETGGGIVQNPLGKAFSWTAGTYTDLGTLGGARSGAYDINDNGQITGFAFTPPNTDGGPAVYYSHAFRYQNGAMTDLGGVNNPLGYSRGHGINAAGDIAGRGSVDKFANSEKHTTVWAAGGGVSQLGGIGPYDTAESLNNNGVVVGNGYIDGNSTMRALVWDANGAVTNLGVFAGGVESRAFSINDAGQVVGFSYDGSDNQLAMISLDRTSIIDLNTLVTNLTGWVRLNAAYDINQNGQIVGVGTTASGEQQAFILTPTAVPVPAAAWLFGSSLLALVGVKRRR